jgi:hypothetical protein
VRFIELPTAASRGDIGDKLDAQLDDQARRFLSTTSQNLADPKTRTLYLSKIFKWYERDFVKKGESLINYILPYLPEDMATEVKKGGFKITYLEYDWSLNDLNAGAAKRSGVGARSQSSL